jgi:PiT family inorganic phosphate transporter
VGAGSAERLSMVRWGFVQSILLTWVLTIPMAGAVSAVVYIVLGQLGVH